jgi:hypothetical protein
MNQPAEPVNTDYFTAGAVRSQLGFRGPEDVVFESHVTTGRPPGCPSRAGSEGRIAMPKKVFVIDVGLADILPTLCKRTARQALDSIPRIIYGRY